jgi:hypothetical protein
MPKYTIYSNVMCTNDNSKLPKTNISVLAVSKLFFPVTIPFRFTKKFIEIIYCCTVPQGSDDAVSHLAGFSSWTASVVQCLKIRKTKHSLSKSDPVFEIPCLV